MRNSLRPPLGIVASALVAQTLVVPNLGAQQQVDILVRGGMVVDGTGSAPRTADVGIVGDRIVFVGDAAASRTTAKRTIAYFSV